MSTITLIDDGGADSTVVSNLFIDNYMKDANDAQLKIYLYLLRMFQAHIGVSVSDIADRFNHTEKDVMRALRYWEKCGVLTLEFGSDRDLCRIRFNELAPARTDAVPASKPVCPEPVSLPEAPASVPLSAPAASVAVISHQTVPAADAWEKPAYTLDELKIFGQSESTAQLFFIAEQYLGRPLS